MVIVVGGKRKEDYWKIFESFKRKPLHKRRKEGSKKMTAHMPYIIICVGWKPCLMFHLCNYNEHFNMMRSNQTTTTLYTSIVFFPRWTMTFLLINYCYYDALPFLFILPLPFYFFYLRMVKTLSRNKKKHTSLGNFDDKWTIFFSKSFLSFLVDS